MNLFKSKKTLTEKFEILDKNLSKDLKSIHEELSELNTTLDEIDNELAKVDEMLKQKESDRVKQLEEMALNAKCSKIKAYEETIKELKATNECQQEHINQLSDELDMAKVRENTAVGLGKEYLAQIKGLENKIKELESNRYRVKQVRASKPKKGQETKLKNTNTNNTVNKMLKEIGENN